MSLRALKRLSATLQALHPTSLRAQQRTMTTSIPETFDINTKYKLNSGYEIPVLGYGVYQT